MANKATRLRKEHNTDAEFSQISLLENLKTSLTSFEAKLDGIQAAVNDHEPKIVSLETNATVQDERISALEASCALLSETNAKLLAKVSKLESRSGRRAKPGQRPRPVIVRQFQRKDLIICEARSKRGTQTDKHHDLSGYPASEKSYTMQQPVNNILTQEETVPPPKKGFMWYIFPLLVLFSVAVLLAYTTIPTHQRPADGGKDPPGVVKSSKFANHLSLLQTQFPSQRPELWKRSKIHLGKHLRTAQPTEPVSLIFTAGLRAEKTLHCLAQRLAASFSSALNASVLYIDGASKAGQDSNQVKLDIDNQLKAAFEGDIPAAVIHRFEELPPGSTLIFYRYCDHENSAYKQVFLLFTVLLPQDEVSVDQSLKDVEEVVHDYVKERLVNSNSQTAFDEMDTDKFGGLWSRISHLILPVVSETEVEQSGCR